MSLEFHDNLRFPTEIEYGFSGGPRFKTTRTQANSGYIQSIINYRQALREYEISDANQTDAQRKELLKFFYQVYGGGIGFRFKDWFDYEATVLEGVFGEDGGHPYTSYKSFGSMSPTEFNNVLNVISSYANSNYDLTGHNCSDFALDILRSIGFVGIDTSGVDNPNTVADYIAKFSDVVNVAGNGPQTQRTCK